MPKVHILPERVANQIAAGEVIERPAAVVKELVENALDAGASRITVSFRHAGRSLVSVEDDGHGMSRDDALLALRRHATSKIAETADLDRLSTFGFRGEALPSIASVSRFSLQTREVGADAGTEIIVRGGRIAHARDCGRPVGTRIDVEHLFEPVPARRKFLKSDRTEGAHIVQCVRLYALASPRVAFTLTEDGREVFRSPVCPSLAERVAEIFGRETAAGLVPIDASEPGMRVSGLIGRPGAGRATRHDLVAFVNGRPVDSRTVNQSVIEGFRESLPKGRFPEAFLFFDCDPAAVDVNVHPAKREVRFRDEQAVRSFVIRSVLQCLGELGASTVAPVIPAGRPPARGPVVLDALRSFAGYPAPQPRPLSAGEPASGVSTAIADSRPLDSAPRRAAPAWRFLGQAHGHYILFEAAAGIVLLDRRAAHERVWFERLREQFRAGATPSQRLLLAVPFPSDPVASAILLDHRDFLNRHGFEIAEFGRNFFRIEAVPAWMEPADAEPFLRDVVGAFREGRMPGDNLDLARDELARLASAKAVRLSAAAGEEEMQRLLGELFATSHPMASPAGRPTYVEFNHGELARRFMAG